MKVPTYKAPVRTWASNRQPLSLYKLCLSASNILNGAEIKIFINVPLPNPRRLTTLFNNGSRYPLLRWLSLVNLSYGATGPRGSLSTQHVVYWVV
jgi:hypothetical protein